MVKAGVSAETISRYEFFIFIAYIASFFWLSATTTNFVSGISKSENQPLFVFNTALALFVFSAFTSLLLVAFFFITNSSYDYYFFGALYLLFNTPSCLNEYILLVKNRHKVLVFYGVAVFTTHIILLLVALFFKASIVHVIFIFLFLAAVQFLFLLYLLFSFAKFSFSKSYFLKFIQPILPLAIILFFSSSHEIIDGALVQKYFSDSDFTLFRFGAREFPILLLLVNALSSTAITKITENSNEGFALIKDKSTQLFQFFFPLTVVLLIFSPTVFQWFYNADFVFSSRIFNLYLLLIIPRLLFPQTILMALGENKMIMIIAISEFLLNFLLSIFMISYFGMEGIVASTFFSVMLSKIFTICYLKFKLNISPSKYILVSQHIYYSGLLLVIYYLTSFQNFLL